MAVTKGLVAHVLTTVKGGAGKTETTDVLEAALTLAGHRCTLIDVDDGNRGLARRVGVENVMKLDWTYGVRDAPAWLTKFDDYGPQHLLFDLGAGIGSSDTPIMAFLQTVWRMLHDNGATIFFHCIVSTNAPTARFIDRVASTYGKIGTVLVVRNDQDGSRAFTAGVAVRPEPQIDLWHQLPGIQEVRLMTRAPLSMVVADPLPGYQLATAFMANRIHGFASQLAAASVIKPADFAGVDYESHSLPRLLFSIQRSRDATDDRIRCNSALYHSHRQLLADGLTDTNLISAGRTYRAAYEAWRSC